MSDHGTPVHLAKARYTAARSPRSVVNVRQFAVPAVAPTCRVCWEGDDNPATSPLLSKTCSCAGSLAHIHARCLLQWQRLAADPHTCATCKSPVVVPAEVAALMCLPPRWLAWLQQQLELAKLNPWKELFKWWHRGVGCVGVLYAAAYSQRAVVEAPGVAVHIRDLPLRQASAQARAQAALTCVYLAPLRWQLLASAAAVSVLQRAWLPWLQAPQRMLRLHLLCYAGGVFLDLAGLHLGQALAGVSALGSMAAPVATGVCKTVTFAGIALQMAAVQHLHPLQQLLSGYCQGASAACGYTGQLLLRPASAVLGLLRCGEGGAVGQLLHATTRVLPFIMHSVAHSLALVGRGGL